MDMGIEGRDDQPPPALEAREVEEQAGAVGIEVRALVASG
jgi:hypothetical protein